MAYETSFEGGAVASVMEFVVNSKRGLYPRSGREATVQYVVISKKINLNDGDGMLERDTLRKFLDNSRDRILSLDEWQQHVRKHVASKLREYPDLLPEHDGVTGYYLTATFFLHDLPDFDEGLPRYEKLDLDNLLKPVLDALKHAKLVQDDSRFKGIKVLKEPVNEKKLEKVALKCIPTQKFRILSVESVAGGEFNPNWANPMQYIHAEQLDAENKKTGREGWFVDNDPGCLFIDQNRDEKIPDAIPGFAWHDNTVVDGCVVEHRPHQNLLHGCGLYWLQKWAW